MRQKSLLSSGFRFSAEVDSNSLIPDHSELWGDIKNPRTIKNWKGTILRPATFMENFSMPSLGISEGKFYNFMHQGRKVPHITTEDIGVFARVIFQDPETYADKIL